MVPLGATRTESDSAGLVANHNTDTTLVGWEGLEPSARRASTDRSTTELPALGLSGWIRTTDILHPTQVGYQAALHSVGWGQGQASSRLSDA